MLVRSAALAAPSLPAPAPDSATMHPRIDAAASVLRATRAGGSLEQRHQQQQQPVHGGAVSSSPPPPSSGTHADGGGSPGGGIIRCQDCWLLAKAGCAHRRCRRCCGGRGFVCPAHVPASSPCSERQQVLTALAASASTTAAVAAPSRKRPLDAVATPTTTTSSSVGQPAAAATVPERFAREVNLDAVFRRVRLGPDDAEVAYHATVTIGGHVFRGILYDVGPRSRRGTASTSTDTGGSSDDGSSRSTAAGGGLDLMLRL